MARAGEHPDGYLPIAEHGLVGDLHTVALVGTNGTIDWYCCPAFDSPERVRRRSSTRTRAASTRCARRPTTWTSKQLYFPDTNVLITRFFTEEGVGEVQDFMPIDRAEMEHAPPSADPPRRRRARPDGLRDRGPAALRLRARRARGRDAPARRAVPLAGPDARARGGDRAQRWAASAGSSAASGGVCATFELAAGDSQTFVLERVPQDHICRPYSERETGAAFDATVAYWRRWVGQSRYRGPLARDGARARR